MSDKLVEKYGITVFEASLCAVIRKIIGTSKCPKWIKKNQKRNMDGPIILQGIGGKSIKMLILVDIHMDINT